MNLNLTQKQRLVLGFLCAWFILLIIGAFARADVAWGHVMLYLAASCATVGIMHAVKPLGIVGNLILGVLVLIGSLVVTIIMSVTIQNAITHIDPLEVWATCLHHTQVLVMIPMEIYRGLSTWWNTGNPEAFRLSGCKAHHLFLVLFFSIVFGIIGLRTIGSASRAE